MKGLNASRGYYYLCSLDTLVLKINIHVHLLFSRYDQLVLISNVATRTLLSQWVDNAITNADELAILVEQHAPFLRDCLTGPRCDASYCWLVKEISRSSPVCALIPVDAVEPVTCLLNQENVSSIPPAMLKQLSDTSPFVYRIVSEGALEISWVREVLEACLHVLQPLVNSLPHEFTDGVESLPYSYLPNLPAIRVRGLYTSDKQKGERVCNKYFQHHKALLPGVFTIHCQHGMYTLQHSQCSHNLT